MSFILPLIVVIPFQTGNSLGLFQSWTSTLFVSPSNFIIPVIIYFKCVQFRKKYNVDHELTGKQLSLLKRIHSKSNTLVKLLGQKALNLDNQLLAAAVVPKVQVDVNTLENSATSLHVPVPVIRTPAESLHPSAVPDDIPVPIPIETLTSDLGSLIQENVPDPDKEDEEEGRLLPPNQNTFVGRLVTTLGRGKKNHNVLPRAGDDIEFNVFSSEPSLPVDLSSKKSNSSSVKPVSEKGETDQRASPYFHAHADHNEVDIPRASETTLDGEPVPVIATVAENDTIEVIARPTTPSEHSLLGIPSKDFARNSWEGNSMDRSGDRLGRLKTLPTHPNFKSPAFRSVPKWMPIRGYQMAWIVLIVTSTVTLGNLILLFLPAKPSS